MSSLSRITSYGPLPIDKPRVSWRVAGTEKEIFSLAARAAKRAWDAQKDERYVIEIEGEEATEIERDTLLVLAKMRMYD